jgi:alpha-D-ribose 1-methylphosphonate 5-triphosphate synthase subunit PhnG
VSTIQSPTSGSRTNARVELARYTIGAGERIVYGQRVLGVVRLTDIPADGRGRHYVIERDLTSMAELEAIVADYLQQAARWDAVPAEPCCLLDDAKEQQR